VTAATGARDDGEPTLKISELAEAAGVPVATVRHYLREGLLPEGRKTSRNMAYYPAATVERIRLIKLLQEERFMPLRVIRELLDREGGDTEAVRALLAESDREIDRALARERERTPAAAVSERYDVPAAVLDRLAEVGILSPAADGYSPSDVRIVAAIARFRAGGYDERIGFTVYDAARFLEPLRALARREVELLSEKLVGRFEPDRAAELIEAGIEPLADLIAAMNSKLITAEIEAHRTGTAASDG
jgi:DNA-binding transcriptional MerR regulator